MRVLLVDDEPRLLEALRRVLMQITEDWEIGVAAGGAAALRELERAPHDVVVSDMRMPGMDGAALLGAVQQHHPHTLRIMLSGQTEQRAALRAVRVAHRFFAKPCTARILATAVDRIQRRMRIIESDRLRLLLTSVSELPVGAGMHDQLRSLVVTPGVDAGALSKLLRQDVGLAAKVLQLSNSSFFARATPSTNLTTAVAHLGVEVTSALVHGGCAHDARANVATKVHERSYLAALIASSICPERADDAFVAALFCDIGRLLIEQGAPDLAAAVDAHASEQGTSLVDAERAVLGVTSSDVGASLLEIWGLPEAVVDAVAAQHAPTQGVAGLDAAVHFARRTAHREPVDPASFEDAAAVETLVRWQSIAAPILVAPLDPRSWSDAHEKAA